MTWLQLTLYGLGPTKVYRLGDLPLHKWAAACLRERARA